MRILVTGGAGFIGSCFVKTILKERPSYEVFNMDKLTYAGNLENLSEIQPSSKYHFVQADIADFEKAKNVVEKFQLDAIINFAAESHVDRSIQDSSAFIHTNIQGTHSLLELARIYKIKRFVQVSTDEVYGSLEEGGYFTENTSLAPNSPYAASKASADLLVRSYFKTYKLPLLISRCSNNYGPYQYPEKLIPLFIIRALQNQELPLYGDGLYVRDWIHVQDHCLALLAILEKGKEGEVYNVGARCERKNIYIAHKILSLLGRPKTLLRSVQDRLGHDRRYAIDPSKIEKELSWKPKFQLDDDLSSLIEWYKNHEAWWRKLS
ncbi:MAG: dTDP-glucose 4,6-dehydratase [Deltaproteobacteria bacterium]|nr:dTDP-glucose 4,6-dehydratase [Deltaproteobacteria bacterium]MBI3018196.1 dTDP-glucose 4,6-dehydratase [Deltaproteobacteria bacterium]